MEKTLNEVEAILKASGIASFLPGSIKDTVCHGVAIDIMNYYSGLIQQAKAEVAREIWDDIVCPMCYMLNPHHENKGEDCNWCSEKEKYTGQTMKQALAQAKLEKAIKALEEKK